MSSFANVSLFFSASRFRDQVIATLQRVNVPVKGVDNGRVRGVFGKGDRLANHGLGETTLNRDDAIETAQSYFLNGNARLYEPTPRGYAATWGVRGTGKTHLIDELVAWMATLPDTFVPIVANFNDRHKGCVYGVDGLLVRMLFAHFVGLAVPLVGGKPCFEDAALAMHALVQENRVRCSQVIDTILFDVDDTRGVVVEPRIAAVFVDEIRKATANVSDMVPCLDVYRTAVNVLDKPNMRLLFTALDQVSAFGIMDDRLDESASGCPITWLSLPPVHIDVGDGDHLLERCVALAHGHPRTIAGVLRVRGKHLADDAQSLFNRIEQAIAGTAAASFAPFLAPALMGIRLQMNEHFDSSKLSFGATIRGGALLNSCAFDGNYAMLDLAVPLLDLFSLRKAAEEDMDGVLRDSVEKLCDLLHKVVSGEEYELLHAHWETALRCLFYKHRIALKCNASMPLLSESPANNYFPLALYRGVTFLTSSGRSVMVRAAACKPVLCLKERLSDTLTEWHDTRGEEVEQIEVGQTVVAGERNAGFDLATLFEEAGKKKTRKHLLLIECKHLNESDEVPAAVTDDNDHDDDDDDDLAHDLCGKLKMQGEKTVKPKKLKKLKKPKKEAKEAKGAKAKEAEATEAKETTEAAETKKAKKAKKTKKAKKAKKSKTKVAAEKKGPGGLSKTMQIMFETVDRVLKSDMHLFVRSGITEASQITYLFVMLRPITDTFIHETKAWISDRKIEFNVAMIARDALLSLYGPSLEGAVAFVFKAEDE
jgi:hypothetical protein